MNVEKLKNWMQGIEREIAQCKVENIKRQEEIERDTKRIENMGWQVFTIKKCIEMVNLPHD